MYCLYHSHFTHIFIVDVPDPPFVCKEDCPPMEVIKTKPVPFTDDLVKDIDIILMTVTDEEYGTVMANTKPLNDGDELIATSNDAVNFYLGRYGPCKVAILKTSQVHDISSDLPKLQKVVKAKYIISVGICFGLNEKKTKLGDVVVSDMIHDFAQDHRGQDESEFLDRPYTVGDTILSMFKGNMGFELKRCEEPEDFVKVVVGPIAFINDPEYILQQAPRALGYEMEGAAIVKAILHVDPQPQVIVIKGIADWGGRKEKSRKWQPFAAHAAAKYVLFQMERLW